MNIRQFLYVVVVAASGAWDGCVPLMAQQRPAAFEDLPELVKRWEKPLAAPGCVAFQPDGKKALFVDAQAVNIFDVGTGKVLRVIPHDLPQFASITCTEEDLAVETGVLTPYRLRVGKISAIKRAVDLDLNGPCYASKMPLLACVGNEGCEVFSNERGQWGSPKWQVEMEEPLKVGFADNDRLVFAVSRTGEFVTAKSDTGEMVANGRLDNWPNHYSLGIGAEPSRRIAVNCVSNRLLVADNEEIRVYDVIKGASIPSIKSVAYPRAVASGVNTSRVIVRVWASKLSDATKEGKRRALVLDAMTGEVSGRFREDDVLNAMAVSPDGQAALAVTGTKGKKGRMSWTLERLDIPGR